MSACLPIRPDDPLLPLIFKTAIPCQLQPGASALLLLAGAPLPWRSSLLPAAAPAGCWLLPALVVEKGSSATTREVVGCCWGAPHTHQTAVSLVCHGQEGDNNMHFPSQARQRGTKDEEEGTKSRSKKGGEHHNIHENAEAPLTTTSAVN